MADWPIYQQARAAAFGQGSGSVGTQVTTGGTAHTKSAWTQLLATTPFAASGFTLHVTSWGTSRILVDVGIGGSGSETVLLPNLQVTNSTRGYLTQCVYLPLAVPAGVRLAVRTQSSGATQACYVCGTLLGGGTANPPGLSRAVAYGANTATSGGTAHDPGTTANTKGAWTEVTSATTADHKAIMLSMGDGNVATATDQSGIRVDIGVGASGSERVIVPDFQIHTDYNGQRLPMLSPVFPADIPEGARLAVRWQTGVTNAARLGEAVLYGFS